MAITYKDSGVDWEKGDQFVRRIRDLVTSTYTDAVETGVGSYAGLYNIGNDQYLASATDGVGTKLMLAQHTGKHDTIGIDLVAMCANDLICVGAKPLFFLDYIVCESLEMETSVAIVDGIAKGCRETGMALIGGETAEHPGCFPKDEYDLSGFCVGLVNSKQILNGESISPGDDLVCLPSSGVHSNGFSLIRKLIKMDETELVDQCMVPTRLYVSPFLKVRDKVEIKGIAHVTGSAFNKVPRLNRNVGYSFTDLPPVPSVLVELAKRSGLSAKELYSTFNMGTGLVLVTADGEGLVKEFEKIGETAYLAGKVTDKASVVEIKSSYGDVELSPKE